jgi:hypothetical protein
LWRPVSGCLEGIRIAVIAAVGGFAVGWVSRPAAQVAAEEQRLKTERRRQVVADFRALLDERFADEDQGLLGIEEDRRFMAIKRRIPKTQEGFDLESLLDAVDELEERWDLI